MGGAVGLSYHGKGGGIFPMTPIFATLTPLREALTDFESVIVLVLVGTFTF